MTPFQTMWKHVNSCRHCSNGARGMCREGERLLKEASTHAAEAMAPMPKEAAKA